jgi:hypothetical protein
MHNAFGIERRYMPRMPHTNSSQIHKHNNSCDLGCLLLYSKKAELLLSTNQLQYTCSFNPLSATSTYAMLVLWPRVAFIYNAIYSVNKRPSSRRRVIHFFVSCIWHKAPQKNDINTQKCAITYPSTLDTPFITWVTKEDPDLHCLLLDSFGYFWLRSEIWRSRMCWQILICTGHPHNERHIQGVKG